MDPNMISIHLFLSKSNQDVSINFKGKTRDTRGFPEIMKFVVQSLVELNNNGKVITKEQVQKILKSLSGDDLEINIIGSGIQ